MKISLLICSFAESKHLLDTLESFIITFPKSKYDLEILVDIEGVRTGLLNTTNRYMDLFNKSTGDIVIKSDDDVFYYPHAIEYCVDIINKELDCAYASPISHKLMRDIGIKHSSDDKLPIYADKLLYNDEPVLSGMCWVFKRWLWEKYPYNDMKTWKLDSEYSVHIHKNNLKTLAYKGAMVQHLGQDRFKSIPTDRPGNPPSEEFRKNNPNENFKI